MRFSGLWQGWACPRAQCDVCIAVEQVGERAATVVYAGRQCLERIVLFAQGRGRGQSDGLYDEGFERDRSRYACRPELAIPGLDRPVADLDVVMTHVRPDR